MSVRRAGAFTFAERPDVAAPDARIIWRAAVDPGTLRIVATPGAAGDPDCIALEPLRPLLSIAVDIDGHEYAVLSDGWRRIRLDVAAGTLLDREAVIPSYQLRGLASAASQVLPLRRFMHLCRTGRFAKSLFPPDPRIARRLTVLRVHDALADGASHREIAAVLFGTDRARHEWRGTWESLRSRVRRLASDARKMASGGYRWLLRQHERDPVERPDSAV